MIFIPSRTKKRVSESLKKYQRITKAAFSKDVNESDTSVIVTDMLCELFGYDKYTEITTETAIRGTFCDLAVSVNKKIKLLLELKAIGLDLKDMHTKQAIDYAANKGIEWVILTNAREWHIYKVSFGKPINRELVSQFNLTDLNSRSQKDLETLFSLTKEGLSKSALSDYYDQSQTTNRYVLGNILVADEVIDVLRREIKKLFPKTRIDTAEIKETLTKYVIKREIIEGEEAELARKKLKRKSKK